MNYCQRCERYFGSTHALQQHQWNSGGHNICYSCNKDFPTARGLTEHFVQSPVHHYCQYCSRNFDMQAELQEHYQDDHYYCPDCNRVFVNAVGLHEHNRQSHHYCGDCRRIFASAFNLASHLHSSVHQSKSVRCSGNGCGRTFTSVAGLMLHLESGTCPSRITRDGVNRFVAQYDTGNFITNPARMIQYRDGAGGTSVTTWATERAWNGRSYECCVCHREFGTLQRLNQHLGSPAHGDKLYRCPRTLEGCGSEFRTLSAFCQHVESEQCGIKRFNHTMQNYVGGLTGAMNRITL